MLGNMLGTQWEKQKSRISTLPQKKKNYDPWCILLHFLLVATIFLLGILLFFLIFGLV
jgi:hypothetical protein